MFTHQPPHGPPPPALTLTSAATDAPRNLRFDSASHLLAATSTAGVEVFDLTCPQGYALALRLPDALSATFSTTSTRLITAHLDQTIRAHHVPTAPALSPDHLPTTSP